MAGKDDYHYDGFGQYEGAERNWPPPRTPHDPSLPGDPPELIDWRGADLSIVFFISDEGQALPFTPGYKIPRTLDCAVAPGDPYDDFDLRAMIPGPAGGYEGVDHTDTEGVPVRYGYWDDITPLKTSPPADAPEPLHTTSAPPNAYTLYDVQQLIFERQAIIIGVPWGVATDAFEGITGSIPDTITRDEAYPLRFMRCLSAISGAGVELNLPYQGHVIPPDADKIFQTVKAYADVRSAETIDVAFVVDNTGSMGTFRAQTRAIAIEAVHQLKQAGYDAYFAYTTFAEWPDWAFPEWVPTANRPDADDDDRPYRVRFPFSPLNEETDAAFQALDFAGENGGDGIECGLEALGRLLAGSDSIVSFDGGINSGWRRRRHRVAGTVVPTGPTVGQG